MRESKCPFMCKDEDDCDSSETDVEYNIFLKNLKEEGTAYAFDDSCTYVEYEVNEDSSRVDSQEQHSVSETKTKLEGKAGAKERNHNQINGQDLVERLKLEKAAIDPCFELFLSHLQVTVGGPFLLKLNDETPVIEYDRQIDIQSEADQSLDGEVGSESETSESSVEVADGCEIPIDNRIYSDSSLFRTRLEAYSAKQFNENEFRSLLSDVRSHKPCNRDKQLRSAIKSYETDEMGKSFLEYYPDFADKVEKACCDKHRFKQLLGFFFWLKNLSHGGAFRPWLDATFNSCPCFRSQIGDQV
ncbi:uncharacterized protein LOC144716989 [Wolffia australiana]